MLGYPSSDIVKENVEKNTSPQYLEKYSNLLTRGKTSIEINY